MYDAVSGLFQGDEGLLLGFEQFLPENHRRRTKILEIQRLQHQHILQNGAGGLGPLSTRRTQAVVGVAPLFEAASLSHPPLPLFPIAPAMMSAAQAATVVCCN